MNITQEGDTLPRRVPSRENLIHGCVQSGIFTNTELLTLLEMFPKDNPLPDNYAELLEKTFRKSLRNKPYTI